MKLYNPAFLIIPVLAFLYADNVAVRASEHGTQKLTKAAIEKEVKADLAKIHPSTEFKMNGEGK